MPLSDDVDTFNVLLLEVPGISGIFGIHIGTGTYSQWVVAELRTGTVSKVNMCFDSIQDDVFQNGYLNH